MFRAFNLSDCGFNRLPREIGDTMNARNVKLVKQALEAFLVAGKVDGSEMQDHWFPKIEADVFISHSHTDELAAIELAGWLKDQFGLNSFIDSCVWGHADELLKQVDDA